MLVYVGIYMYTYIIYIYIYIYRPGRKSEAAMRVDAECHELARLEQDERLLLPHADQFR